MWMTSSDPIAAGIVIAAFALAIPCTASPQALQPKSVDIPEAATRLEGLPVVRIDSTEAGTTRHPLTRKEAVKNRVEIRVVGGKYYWATRENLPLELHSSGEFTYLSSAEPGKYIKFTRLNDKISYVEHLDQDLRSVTYWGELRVVVGK